MTEWQIISGCVFIENVLYSSCTSIILVMYLKLLNRFFAVIVSREMMVLIGLVLFASSLPLFVEQFRFIARNWSVHPSLHAIEEMEELLDGFGGILVAAGVFFESRETLVIMSQKQVYHKTLDHYLTEVAHHNGMGILLMGLFIEIGTQVLELPTHVFNSDGLEYSIFVVCFLLSTISLIIIFDFLKDYIKTYFLKKYKGDSN